MQILIQKFGWMSKFCIFSKPPQAMLMVLVHDCAWRRKVPEGSAAIAMGSGLGISRNRGPNSPLIINGQMTPCWGHLAPTSSPDLPEALVPNVLRDRYVRSILGWGFRSHYFSSTQPALSLRVSPASSQLPGLTHLCFSHLLEWPSIPDE